MENLSLKVEKINNIFLLTLRAGENRFTDALIDHLHEALDFVQTAKGAAALVTTSSDPKYYSLGLEVKNLKQQPAKVAAYLEKYQQLLSRVVTFPMPTVAAIGGHAAAGGALFAMAHDIRLVCEERGFFLMNEIDLGLWLPAGMAAMIKYKIANPNLVRDVAVFGKKYQLSETVRLGIFDEAVPNSELVHRAVAIAKTMAPKATHQHAMVAIKNEIYKELCKELNAKVIIMYPML